MEVELNHKGEWCIYNSKTVCQEGDCRNCYLAKGISGICKAKDLTKEITFRGYGIGDVWRLDETDTEIITKN